MSRLNPPARRRPPLPRHSCPRTAPSDRMYDVAIVGAGFSGSLLAWILASRGRRVLLLDRHAHPRFAVGESSTPLADLILQQLADRYDLPALSGLTTYGRWKRQRPELTCGCKRGFSYFRHHPDRRFEESDSHDASLLVAASRSGESADTHWLRSDVDHFLCSQAMAEGVDFRERTEAELVRGKTPWQLRLRPSGWDRTAASAGAEEQITARFLVGAAGREGDLFASLGVRDHADELGTRTQSTFGHFSQVRSWSAWLEQHGFREARSPFDADQAAQHHLLDDGWLWMLRMDDGRTSVGWTRPWHPSSAAEEAAPLAQLGLTRYPSLAEMFSDARCIAPENGLIQSGRLQRLRLPIVGEKWALMPTAAVTIDPLHSGGIAHGLAGVERLADLLLNPSRPGQQTASLARYQADVLAEARLLDRLIAGSYQAMRDFPLFVATSMLYFAAAIGCEERRAAGKLSGRLWSADDPDFVGLVKRASQRIARLTQGEIAGTCSNVTSPSTCDAFGDWLRRELVPWNSAGLLDPTANNRYRYTAADGSGGMAHAR